jgi:hypothetical protein
VVENLVVAEHGELMVVQACAVQNLPLMVGGSDFNIIHTKKITLDTMRDGHSYLML